MAKGKSKGKGHRRASTKRNPPKQHRRRARRNPRETFGRALLKVGGAIAATLGVGVVNVWAVSKFPDSKVATFGIPIGTAILGAGIATRMPVLGLGVAAGAAAPFVYPITDKTIGSGTSSTAAKALSAVAMGATGYRELPGHYPSRVSSLRAVSMARAG